MASNTPSASELNEMRLKLLDKRRKFLNVRRNSDTMLVNPVSIARKLAAKTNSQPREEQILNFEDSLLHPPTNLALNLLQNSSSQKPSPKAQSPSKSVAQCLQNFNNKFLRKRHSLSFLKYDSNPTSNLPKLDNTKNKSSLNLSLNSNYEKLSTPSTNIFVSSIKSSKNTLTLPISDSERRFKIPFKLKSNAGSRHGSFKEKKKQNAALARRQ